MTKKKIVGVRQRGESSFEINYRDADGKRQWETLDNTTLQEACNVRQARVLDVKKGLPVSSKPNTVTFEELAADVVKHYEANELDSTADIERRFRLHLIPFFGHLKAAKVTTANFNAYIVQRRAEGSTAGNINRELEAARRAYKLAMNATPKKVLTMPKIPMLKEKNVRKGFFERHQLEAICRHLPKHLVPVAQFGYITGWRHSEVMTRCWRHIDFEAGEIALEPGETKNDEGRTFPMTRELRELLEGIRPKGPLFPNKRVFVNEEGDPIGRFDKAWATACLKAGLPVRWVEKRNSKGEILRRKRKSKAGARVGDPILICRAAVYFHDFRRSAYRNLVRLGIPESVAQKAVGWLDPDTARRYDITAKADLDVIRERLDGGNFGGSISRSFTEPVRTIAQANTKRKQGNERKE